MPGTLFICLCGLNADGHNYINAAAVKGATAVLVEKQMDEFPEGLTVIRVENSRQAMAYIAANFHGNPAQKLRLIGITGTNGKTTTTYFTEEILRKLGRKTGLIGTVGASVNGVAMDVSFATSTTPDPLELHAIFAKMLQQGVQDVVMEVSSHALALYKMEGLIFDVGVFTNLTQDHLDFHGTMENYRLAKAQLFAQSKFAVVNIDDVSTHVMLQLHGDDPFLTYSLDKKSDLQATNIEYLQQGSTFDLDGMRYNLPVAGKFNVYNILAAIGVARALGCAETSQVISEISNVPGRIQSVPNNIGAHILVDYAHSPDGLQNIISSVREFVTGRVVTLFGCGGDRNTTKRPIMGRIAAQLSDYCILTSDNPRTEDPFAILLQVELGVKETLTPYEICENRKNAIFAGVKMLKPGDALIIAGKGHEDYQEIGNVKYPFSDYATAAEVISGLVNDNERERMFPISRGNPLITGAIADPSPNQVQDDMEIGMNLTIREIVEVCGGQILCGSDSGVVNNLSIDSRKISQNAIFVSIKGEAFDGHDYIHDAVANGAACVMIDKPEKYIPCGIPVILVKSTRRALMDLAAYYRRKHDITVVAITGSAGKTTTKDMIAYVLARKYKTKKTIANFNNDIGLPLSIFQLRQGDEVLVLEMGMNHAMEIHELSKVGAPDITVITHIGDAHIENFDDREGILHAKLEIVDGQKPGGTVILNGDDPLLTGSIAAKKVEQFTVQFPSSKNIIKAEEKSLLESECHFNWRGQDIKLIVPIPGAHMVMNALLAAAVGVEMGVPPSEISQGFDDFVPPSGRLSVEYKGGMTIINDAYNANPAAMRESIKILCKQPTRKIAILGDMNELGHVSKVRHKEIGAYAATMGIDLLVAIGPESWYIYEEFCHDVPARRLDAVGGVCAANVRKNKIYFATVDEFLPQLNGLLNPGDVVLIKASRGMAFERIVENILEPTSSCL